MDAAAPKNVNAAAVLRGERRVANKIMIDNVGDIDCHLIPIAKTYAESGGILDQIVRDVIEADAMEKNSAALRP